MFLSFLKRERERFPLFVPKRCCVPTRTFLGVPDRSASTVLDRLHERLHDRSMTVPERSTTVSDRFMSVFELFMNYFKFLDVFYRLNLLLRVNRVLPTS